MQDLVIPFSLSNPWKFSLQGLPLRCSVPLPEGAVEDPAAELVLKDENGNDCAAQWRVLSTWNDGSARFALMDYAESEMPPVTTRNYTLKKRSGENPVQPRQMILVKDDNDSMTIDTGRLVWTFSKKRFSFAEAITFCDRDWIGGKSSDLVVHDRLGRVFRASEGSYSIVLEENGPYRVIVLVKGDYRDRQDKFMNYWMRFHFTAGGSQVLMIHHLRNREPGREGRDITRSALRGGLNIGANAMHRVLHLVRTRNNIPTMIEVPEDVDLDVGLYETSIRNEASLREDPDDICYSLKQRLELASNCSCAPLIDMYQPGIGGMLLKLAMPYPTFEAPMHLGADRGHFEIDFFSGRGDIIHLNEGMGKTRDALFNFHDESLGPDDLCYASNNLSYPGVVSVPHEVYRECKFADVHLTLVSQPNKYPLLERKIEVMRCAGPLWNTVTVQTIPYLNKCYGWRDFGDFVAVRNITPVVNHRQYLNNEEDFIYSAMIDAWRTGRAYDAVPMVRHLMDIDYIDYSTDPARNGASCPHSANHTDGEVYPSHQWCQGLLYFYLGTGDEEALRIARRIGDCLCWWVTGPRKICLRGSGRESAWPLLSLAALYEVTHEEKYKEAGMAIIDEMIAIYEKHGRLVWETPLGSGILTESMLYMTFNGVWDMYAATGEERVLDLWKKVTAPVVEKLADADNFGYIHFRNPGVLWPDLTVLVRWYNLTGDKKYIELGKIGLRFVLAGYPQPLNPINSTFTMGYRHFIFFLKLADEFGMIDDDHCTVVW